jgi:hypothetical protein
MMLCQERAVSCIIPDPASAGPMEELSQEKHSCPALIGFSIIPTSHLSRLLVYVTFIQSRGLLEVGKGGFVLKELNKSGRGLRENLLSAPNSPTLLVDLPRETPSNPHRHNTHTPC